MAGELYQSNYREQLLPGFDAAALGLVDLVEHIFEAEPMFLYVVVLQLFDGPVEFDLFLDHLAHFPLSVVLDQLISQSAWVVDLGADHRLEEIFLPIRDVPLEAG